MPMMRKGQKMPKNAKIGADVNLMEKAKVTPLVTSLLNVGRSLAIRKHYPTDY
jgi:hypothetical protein